MRRLLCLLRLLRPWRLRRGRLLLLLRWWCWLLGRRRLIIKLVVRV